MARDGGGIGSILSWGLILGGGYLLWNWWQSQQAAAPAGAPAPPTPVTPAPPTPTAAANVTSPTPSASSASILDSWYAAMVKAANATTLNPDQWGFYLSQVTGFAAPDPIQAFPNFSRASNWPNITAAQYWTNVAPLVARQKGLSGYGLLAGLGRYAMGRLW